MEKVIEHGIIVGYWEEPKKGILTEEKPKDDEAKAEATKTAKKGKNKPANA